MTDWPRPLLLAIRKTTKKRAWRSAAEDVDPVACAPPFANPGGRQDVIGRPPLARRERRPVELDQTVRLQGWAYCASAAGVGILLFSTQPAPAPRT